MAVLNGPELDKMVAELKDWYVRTKRELIALLEEDYPYGTVKLDAGQQAERLLTMTEQDFQSELARLRVRFRGEPNAEGLVLNAVQDLFGSYQAYLTQQRMNAAPIREGS